MKAITLNSYVLWESLPWKTINQRIFILQEKIYKFAQECKQKKIHNLQNYILNSSDAKLLAIEEVSSNINKYYLNHNKEKYNISDLDKLYLYNSLFSIEKISKNNQIIIEYIKQYLVYMCLKPEWEARFEPIYHFNINNRKKRYSIYKLSNFFSKKYIFKLNKTYIYSIYSQTINKYNNISKVVNRIQSLPCISYYINYWLNNQYLLESLKIDSNFQNYFQIRFNYLENLLYNIICNGIEWHIINTLNCNSNIFKNLYLILANNNKFEIYINNYTLAIKYIDFVKSIVNTMKFYHNNYNNFCIYKIQSLTNKINIAENFLIMYENKVDLFNFDNNLTIQIHLYFYTYFVWYIKNFLYNYNKLGKLRICKDINSSKALIKINILIIELYKYYYPIINLNNINKLFKLIDNILLVWFKKNNKNISLLYINHQYVYNKISKLR